MKIPFEPYFICCLWGLSLLFSACEFTDMPPSLDTYSLNEVSDGAISLELPDTIVLRAQFSDDVSLAEYLFSVKPEFTSSITERSNISPYQLDTTIMISGVRVNEFREFVVPNSAERGRYIGSLTFKDDEDQSGEGFDIGIEIQNPFPTITLTEPLTDSLFLAPNDILSIQGNAQVAANLLDSLSFSLKKNPIDTLRPIIINVRMGNLGLQTQSFSDSYSFTAADTGVFLLDISASDTAGRKSELSTYIQVQ